MRLVPCALAFVVLVSLLGGNVGAQTSNGLDQYQLGSTHIGLLHSANPVGQWFTVGFDGLLWAVELSLGVDPATTQDLTVEVRDVSGGFPGVLLGSTALAPADIGTLQVSLQLDAVTGTLIQLDSLGIPVAAGDQIGVWLLTDEVSPQGYLFAFAGITDLYASGDMLSGSGPNVGLDLAFKVFLALPIFADDLESGGTTAWSATVP